MGYEPSLTHVCMWLNKSWKAISAAQAYALTGGTGVSSDQRMFICNLCGQFVTLTSGYKQQPHFRHSAGNKDKSCEQRTFATGDGSSYDPSEHLLPIRMVKSKYSNRYSFELGLIRAPIADLADDFAVSIRPCEHTYTKDKLNTNSITYVDVGSLPYPQYVLSFREGSEELYEYWPSIIPGINPHGTLFNKETGRKLIHDADVLINKDYLLLIYGSLPIGLNFSISIKNLEHKQAGWDGWSLYEVRATDYDDESALFFINYHCRLTEKPASIQPIWPLYSEGSFIIRHNNDKLNLLVSGNVSALKSFPRTAIDTVAKSHSDATLYELHCSDRQQLISTGRAKVLQYTYFWREPLSRTGVAPKVSVRDLDGNELYSAPHLVHKTNTVIVSSPFDGYILVTDKGYILDRLQLKGGSETLVENLQHNTSLKVFVGQDMVWCAKAFGSRDSGQSRHLLEQHAMIDKPEHGTEHGSEDGIQGLNQASHQRDEMHGFKHDTAPENEGRGFGYDTASEDESHGFGHDTASEDESRDFEQDTAADDEMRGFEQDTAADDEMRGFGHDTASEAESRGFEQDTAADDERRGFEQDTAADDERRGFEQDTAADDDEMRGFGKGALIDDSKLVQHLNRLSGTSIKAPHSMRNLQGAFKAYPQLSAWIRQRIIQGTINERAYRLLQQVYSQVKKG